MPELELIAGGLAFPEGPAFDSSGRLYWTDMEAGRIGVVDPNQPVPATFVHTGGNPNGCNFDSEGNLYIAEAGLKQVLKATPEGELSVFAEGCDGEPFTGPNDVVFDAAGNAYFTDPVGSDADSPTGRVYFGTPEGRITQVADGLAFPNGLTLTPDGKTLIVAETMTYKLLQYDVLPDGTLGPAGEWGRLHEDGVGGDGMALSANGNLYVAHYGRGVIAVLDRDGSVIEELPAGGARPTNVAFGGPGFDELYITETETNAIYRMKLGEPGEPLFPDR